MYAIAFAIFLAVMSLIAFFVYAADKARAKKKKWRIPEKTLLCLSFFGGAPGGYAAMLVTRHKTAHWYFHAVNLAGIAWQAAALVFLIVS